MDRPLLLIAIAFAAPSSCDVGDPVSTAPVVYREDSRLSSDKIMSCLERIGIETYFPGVEYFAIAAGRVAAPDSGGYRADDGTAITVTHQFPKPTIVAVHAHAPLNELQRGMLSHCTQ